jgi:putative ABC transport system permease protein
MSLFTELRIAGRRVLRHPGYALGVVATLALGVAVCAAMYSVVHGVVIKGLDYPDPERIVVLRSANTATAGEPMALSGAEAEMLGGLDEVLEAAGYFMWGGATYLGGDAPRMLTVFPVGGEFFRTLGVQPLLGRWLTAADAGSEGRVVLSHELWMELFGGDPAALGQTLRMDWIVAEIVGVMPPGFGYPARGPHLWIGYDPTEVRADPVLNRNARFFLSIARVRPGVSAEALADALARHSLAVAETHGPALADWRLQATRLLDDTIGHARPMLLAMLLIAVLALLVACANVVNLVVLRGVGRMHEFGVHQALGASHARLARLVFLETLILGLLATAAGVVLAALALEFFVGIADSGVPRSSDVRLDLGVAVIAAGFGLLASLLAAALPALKLRRLDAIGALRGGDGRVVVGLGFGARVLPVAACAVSVGGLAVAMLLAASVWRLERVPLGYDTDPVLYMQVFHGPEENPGQFNRGVIASVGAVPGVEAVATISSAPLVGIGNIPVDVVVPGRETREAFRPRVRTVAGPVEEVLGLTLLRGRWLDPGDRHDSQRVAVVNQAFADRVFPGADPIGQVVAIPPFGQGGDRIDFSIVGVMGDARMTSVAQSPVPEIWVPDAQYWVSSSAVLVRSAVPVANVLKPAQQAFWTMHPDQGIYMTQTLAAMRERQFATPRFFARNAGAFATLALLLAAVGVHSVVAFQMAQRQREFALRLALGSAPTGLARRALRQGLALGIPAAAVGAGLGVLFGRGLRGMVVDIADAVVWSATASGAMLLLVVLLASARSALAVLRVQPMAVLRNE